MSTALYVEIQPWKVRKTVEILGNFLDELGGGTTAIYTIDHGGKRDYQRFVEPYISLIKRYKIPLVVRYLAQEMEEVDGIRPIITPPESVKVRNVNNIVFYDNSVSSYNSSSWLGPFKWLFDNLETFEFYEGNIISFVTNDSAGCATLAINPLYKKLGLYHVGPKEALKTTKLYELYPEPIENLIPDKLPIEVAELKLPIEVATFLSFEGIKIKKRRR